MFQRRNLEAARLRRRTRTRYTAAVVLATVVLLGWPLGRLGWAASPEEASTESGETPAATRALEPSVVAASIDQLLDAARGGGRGVSVPTEASRSEGASRSEAPARLGNGLDDAAFLRRVTLDLIGRRPHADELTAFAFETEDGHRMRRVRELIGTNSFARHWAAYWRDAILYRTEDRRARALAPALQKWLQERFAADRSWHETVTDLLTVQGDVGGSAGFVVAQMAEPVNLAAETARLFLGIQLQCAQCHDHPYDDWKREQFHELAAFFSRVRLRRKQTDGRRTFEIVSLPGKRGANARNPARLLRRLDRNGDGQVSADEVPKRLLGELGGKLPTVDADASGGLDAAELENVMMMMRPRRGGGEYRLPDLEHPDRPGRKLDPRFFLGGAGPKPGADDLTRRQLLARSLVETEEPFLARAFVNRVWARLMGRGFVEPVDDMGPRKDLAANQAPEILDALDLLAGGFRDSGYRLGWLVTTITATRAYQSLPGGVVPTKAAGSCPSPRTLSGDELFAALLQTLAFDFEAFPNQRRRRMHESFSAVFGRDPSTPEKDVQGTLPQALFLMNSRLVHGRVQAQGDTPLARLLERDLSERAVVEELYLRTLARMPNEKEVATCSNYLRKVGRQREALEDIFWSLINSTEFLLRD